MRVQDVSPSERGRRLTRPTKAITARSLRLLRGPKLNLRSESRSPVRSRRVTSFRRRRCFNLCICRRTRVQPRLRLTPGKKAAATQTIMEPLYRTRTPVFRRRVPWCEMCLGFFSSLKGLTFSLWQKRSQLILQVSLSHLRLVHFFWLLW